MRSKKERPFTVINRDCNGKIIEDMTKVVIRHDDFPGIWDQVAALAEKLRLNNETVRGA